METGAVHELPHGRHFALDERGVALRATWRLDRGFVNLSLWRDDTCVETFHLTPTEASRLVTFLVSGMADAATSASLAGPALAAVPTPLPRRVPLRERVAGEVARARSQGADLLERAGRRLRP